MTGLYADLSPEQKRSALACRGLDTDVTKVPDADPDAAYRRMTAARHRQGVTTFYEPRVAAVRTLRDDPLGLMHSRKQVGEAQYAAGRRYQATREAQGIGRSRSPGDIREHVDGGRIASDGITDDMVVAGKRIAAWRSRIGDDGYWLLEAVLIEKRSIREYADASPMMSGKAATTFYGHRFRECLSTLAKLMGLSG